MVSGKATHSGRMRAILQRKYQMLALRRKIYERGWGSIITQNL